MDPAPTNILIIKPSALGDIVMVLPALNALRTLLPQATISWLVQPEFAPLLEDHPQLDRIISFDRQRLAGTWRNIHSLRALLHLRRDLRGQQFDCVLDFQGLLRSALLGHFTGTTLLVGMANAREGAHWLYSRTIHQDTNNLHVVDFNLKLVQSLSAEPLPQAQFVFPRPPEARAWAQTLFEQRALARRSYVVFVAGSTQGDKCWPAKRFADLADRLHNAFGLPILAVGSAGEAETIDQIGRQSRRPLLSLAGQTSLPQLVALLDSAALVVANDTGPGHVAAGLGVPLVMLFSWSNPARIYPYRRPECMVAVDPFGRGRQIKSRDPRHNVRNITVDEVFERACEQLNGQPGRTATNTPSTSEPSRAGH